MRTVWRPRRTTSWCPESAFRNKVQAEIPPDGTFVKDFIPSGSGGLSTPYYLAYGPDGNLYVSGDGGIKKYDGQTGAYLGDVFTAHGGHMLFDPDGSFYLSDYDHDSVEKVDANTGQVSADLQFPAQSPERAGFQLERGHAGYKCLWRGRRTDHYRN